MVVVVEGKQQKCGGGGSGGGGGGKTIEFYGLQNYINAHYASILSVYILLLRS